MPERKLNVYQLREIERMEAYQQPSPYPASPRMIRLVNVLIAALILALIALVVIRVSASGDHWICQSAAIYSFAPGVRQAEWNGETWRVLDTHDPGNPADDVWHLWSGDSALADTGIMYADRYQNENGPAYVEFLDYESGLGWRFAFIDTVSTFEDGRWGMHHSCEQGPVVFDLGPR